MDCNDGKCELCSEKKPLNDHKGKKLCGECLEVVCLNEDIGREDGDELWLY